MTSDPTGDSRVLETLRSVFGYNSFKPLQDEIVRSILRRQDVFVVMPTGGGKSLCYQLPALLLEGTTLVISPLIALMKDQVDALRALGVAATFINSSLDFSETRLRQAALARGEIKLLYVAPERLMSPAFLDLLSSLQIALITIDEAHCISEWGHDFRPEYRQLSRLRELFPRSTLGTFTATATERVQADIKGQLGLAGAACFHGSYNRPNLFYAVRPKQSAFHQLLEYLQLHQGASGIIYCQARAQTEDVAGRLKAQGFRAAPYHAGMDSEERRLTQEAFIRDNIDIIVATIAFGMGIDKPDVRFVIHYDMPKSLEGYYQESGRAGRDGDPSDCILFYSYGDTAKYQYFIGQKESAEERAIALEQLQRMADWASDFSCRRRALLAYFGEELAEQPAPCCDACDPTGVEADCTTAAQMFLSCAKRTGERFGAGHLIDILRGSRSEKVLRQQHETLSVYGIGRDRPKREWQHIAHQLVRRGYVRQTGEYRVIEVTELGRAVLFKGEKVFLPVPESDVPRLLPAGENREALFERLRVIRKRIADDKAVPPYVVFHDSTLRQIAQRLPTTTEELLRIDGVGQHKASTYGRPFLECVAEYVAGR